MNVSPINNSQSFKRLDYRNVSNLDRVNFIQKNFYDLQKLGEKYDIRLTSCYTDLPGFAAIDIEVKPLREGLNFIKRFMRPKVLHTFKTGYTHIDEPLKTKEDFMKSVRVAVDELKKKL